MSILIKGMDLPENGEVILIFPNRGDGLASKYKRCDVAILDFPMSIKTAINIPPHGRLIDADEIVKYKERLVKDACKIKREYRYVVDVFYIKDAPTIIEAEE